MCEGEGHITNIMYCNRWSVVHRCELAKQGSCLEFKLRKLKFIVLVSGGHTEEALAYAKVFGQFAPCHLTGRWALNEVAGLTIS